MRNEIHSPARRTNHTTRLLVARFLADPNLAPADLREFLRGVGVPRHRVEEIINQKVRDAVHC